MEYPFENKLYELDIKVVEDDSNVFSEIDDISTTGEMTLLLTVKRCRLIVLNATRSYRRYNTVYPICGNTLLQ